MIRIGTGVLLLVACALAGWARAEGLSLGDAVRLQGTRDAGSAALSLELPAGVEDVDVATSDLARVETTEGSGTEVAFSMRLPLYCAAIHLGDPGLRPLYLLLESDAAAAPEFSARFSDGVVASDLELACRTDGVVRRCVARYVQRAQCALFGAAADGAVAKEANPFDGRVDVTARRAAGAGAFVVRHALTLRSSVTLGRAPPHPRGLALASTGRDRAAAGRRTFDASWLVPTMRGGDTWVAFVDATPAAGASRLYPVLIDVAAQRARESIVLFHNRAAYVTLAPGESHERIVFDVPRGVSGFTGAFDSATGRPFDVEFVPPRAASSGPDVAPAPVDGAVTFPARVDPAVSSSLYPGFRGSAVTPGRWYMRVRNPNAEPIDVLVSTTFLPAATADVPDGVYFNPERPGHGVFLGRSGAGRVLIWFTYDASGAPTWYLGQLPYASTINLADYWVRLRRYVWRDGIAREEAVGDAAVTLTAQRGLTFAWSLGGRSGSETLVPLVDCAAGGGTLTTWFAPAQPGYGLSALRTPSFDLDVVYLYDAGGNPRWLVAQDAPGAGERELLQTRGFCPNCSHAPVQSAAVGRLARSYGASQGTARVDATFRDGVEGRWTTDAAISALTSNAACQ